MLHVQACKTAAFSCHHQECACVRACVRACVCACVCVQRGRSKSKHTRAHTHTRTHTHTHAHTHAHTQSRKNQSHPLTGLSSWLVCSLPMSPMLEVHTMSSFPMSFLRLEQKRQRAEGRGQRAEGRGQGIGNSGANDEAVRGLGQRTGRPCVGKVKL